MIDNFPSFARLVAGAFQRIVKSGDPVFVSSVAGDDLYDTYIKSFPEGTNPIFVKETEHSCSTCKGFIRRAGGTVAVNEAGHVSTVWDDAAAKAPHPYNVVAGALRDMVQANPIADLFRVSSKEASFGAPQSRSQDRTTLKVTTWNHLHTGEIPSQFRVASPGEVCGAYRTSVEVFQRGLTELTPGALDTVMELITSNALYRGEEQKGAVAKFQKAQKAYLKLGEKERHTFAWARAQDSAARFRNTAIGTLVVDLSEGVDLERAVRSFESKVAPGNYKRPTALVTPGMVATAMKTIKELDLESALERRLATLADISVRDVLWVSGDAKPLMRGGIEGLLMAHVQSTNTANVDVGRAEDITLEELQTRILPTATGLELLFDNGHVGNLMVITAPVNSEPKSLFRWSNDFGWSYAGSVTDGIRERVKAAGGRVEGASLRVSLSWGNFDDLDLHAYEPAGRGAAAMGGHIYFGARQGWTGGRLDVDMNAGRGTTRTPVENIVWTSRVPDGAYRVSVHNYAQRETSDVGFTVEVECAGQLSHFTFNKAVKNNGEVPVCTLHMKDGVISNIEAGDPGITSAAVKQTKWGLTTGQFVKVNMVTLSPNYWSDNRVGNRHTFFVLDGCACDDELRGIYNEFLSSKLEPHRKVFELIGDKTKCRPVEGGLAGIGVSSTKNDTITLRVRNGSGQRTYNVSVK